MKAGNIKKWVGAIIVAAFAMWIIYIIFFPLTWTWHVEKTLTAAVYRDGRPVAATEIVIDGEQCIYLFPRTDMAQSYVGTFAVGIDDRTTREGAQVGIRWKRDGGIHVEYYYAGDFKGLDLDLFRSRIDKNLEHIALRYLDGTIVATSPELAAEAQRTAAGGV